MPIKKFLTKMANRNANYWIVQSINQSTYALKCSARIVKPQPLVIRSLSLRSKLFKPPDLEYNARTTIAQRREEMLFTQTTSPRIAKPTTPQHRAQRASRNQIRMRKLLRLSTAKKASTQTRVPQTSQRIGCAWVRTYRWSGSKRVLECWGTALGLQR